jgi:hypothetical protein
MVVPIFEGSNHTSVTSPACCSWRVLAMQLTKLMQLLTFAAPPCVDYGDSTKTTNQQQEATE